MKIFTRTLVCTLVLLSFSLITKAAKIAILESQSIVALHNMDENWYNTATALGHEATIVDQNFLDDYSNLDAYDAIITASGLIEIPDNRKANLLQFVQSGRSIYIQSEYLINLPGNTAFQYLADNFGSSFAWEGEVSGQIAPMEITGSIASDISDGLVMNYFWYGTYGTGDASFESILSHDNKSWGFVYYPPVFQYGKVVTTSDQDWVRIDAKNSLMVAIIDLILQPAILDLPTVSIESSISVCDSTYTFNATIEDNVAGTTLQWLLNGQPISGATAAIYVTQNLDEGDVIECQLELSNFGAVYTHVSNPILIAPILPTSTPVLTIAVDNANFCQGQTITFTTNITEAPDSNTATFQWYVNNQAIGGATAASFSTNQLSDADEVSCQLQYLDSCGAPAQVLSNPIQLQVVSTLNPTLSIAADWTTICAGQIVQFTATATEAGVAPSYQWKVDGQNVGTNSPIYSSSQLTNDQTVSCVLSVQESCSTTNEVLSNPITITVTDLITPSIEVLASTTTICTGQEVTFTAMASNQGNNPTYQWYIDGNAVGTSSTSFTTAALINGQLVSCVLTASDPCYSGDAVSADPISILVTEDVIPTLALQASASNVCPGQSVSITAGGEHHGPSPIYNWTVNGVLLAEQSASINLEDIQSIQQVSCQLINNDDCAATNVIDAAPISITAEALSIEIAEFSHENCGSADGLIEAIANGGTAPYTFHWSNNQGESLLTDLAAGVYTLTLSDALGCNAVADLELVNSPGPEITAIDIIDADCDGHNSLVTIVPAEGQNNLEYSWKNAEGDIIARGTTVRNLAPGNYEIDVTNLNGCNRIETISVGQSAGVFLTIDDHYKMNLGEDLRLEAFVPSNEVSYEWFPTEGLSCTDCSDPIANPVQTTVYTLTVTHESGCTATQEVVVQVVPKEELFIPNAFSPNGDGINDFFTVYAGTNIARIVNMRIFDRWGAEVFANEDFMPNVEGEGWNGSYRGKFMDRGVFLYFVEVEYIDGSIGVHKGDLSITN